MGEEPESPVRFEIYLKRAEIVFVIPAGEPLKVLQSSVKREPPIAVKTEISKTAQSNSSISGSAGLDINKGALDLSAKVDVEKAGALSQIQRLDKLEGALAWAQAKSSDGYYKWEIAPSFASNLLGKIWDAVSEPLLRIKQSPADKGILDSICRIEIRCRREDLDIRNIQIKGESNFKFPIGSRKGANKMAAVEAYIRNALASRNLDIKNFEDPYGHIMLADVIVQEQVE